MNKLTKGGLLEIKVAYLEQRRVMSERPRVDGFKRRTRLTCLPDIKVNGRKGKQHISGGLTPFFREMQAIAVRNGLIDELTGRDYSETHIRYFFSFDKCKELHCPDKTPEQVYWQIFRTLVYE